MKDTVFLTGGTGFLGTELAARLVRQAGNRIYVLVRAADPAEALHRLRGAWHHDRDLFNAIGTAVFPVTGDFTKTDLGLCEADALFLKENTTLVIHAGAQTGLQKDSRELTAVNTAGTENMLTFALGMKNLRRFVYISTAYVSGRKTGIIMEEDPAGTDFSSFYEQSKAMAEALVKRSSLPFTICRPGMIVGDSRSGWIRNFNTIYYVLKQMLLGGLRVLPIDPQTPLNLVPGDYVADSILQLLSSEDTCRMTFHLTCPEKAAPTAAQLADYVRTWAKSNLGITLPRPVFRPLPLLKQTGLSYNRRETGRKKNLLSNMLALMPYFYGNQTYDRTNTDHFCGPYRIDWRTYIDPLLAFSCRKNFMRQTGQTVFEQAKVRRESSRYPINYYDITAKGIRKVSGPDVNRRIERIVKSLLAWGIRKGDRIALTGINSVSYLALEQAVGLIGAVSVPIYYTTPAAETSLLLHKSGAKWFFIGDRRMMEQVPQIETTAKLVSFSDGQTIRHASVLRWKKFLERSEPSLPLQYPDPEDLATIRYTSGTTGEPKGVTFRYWQLAWMGEVLTNLLPWKDRNHSMSYLSFLPLSHVVEGILASYAPYYLLAKVDYYYLNDFSSLTGALPKVRPSVFFSVPRFYEKVWDQVMANSLGRAWFSRKESPAGRAMAPVLRRAVLKKAGIDRCRQLIVGSAPVSETLLHNFRSLGVEIYNAYGQTEAPLITINRLGDNVIPTIGTPLPDTVVTAEPDGELIVEGPQVTPGYYGIQSDNIRDGVLRTGDLGTIHENGHITLHGRKKDFIITAYGKNISITKIEEKLKDIEGVTEAVLIGENRPYCAALLWADKEIPDLDAQIEKMNAGLSHPEQIRRYRIISRPLSIKAGELTPNLKVKRKNVEQHLSREIEEMYL